MFRAGWPATLATPAETEAYRAWRDVHGVLGTVAESHPALGVIVVASERDHVQTHPEHPHVALIYCGLRNAGLSWIRLNPDRAYVGSDLAPDNPANIDWPAVLTGRLVPEEAATDLALMRAAVEEPVDRTHDRRWDASLDQRLR